MFSKKFILKKSWKFFKLSTSEIFGENICKSIEMIIFGSLLTTVLCEQHFWAVFARKQGSVSPTYLRTAFMPVAPKSVRIQSFFTLLESTGAKAARRTLMKLTPGLNFINILRTTFTFADPKSAKRFWRLDWLLCFWELRA